MSEDMSDALYIGLDFEGPHLKAALCDAEGQIVSQRRQAVPPGTEDRLMAQLIGVVKEFCETEDEDENIVGVGIGVPGLVDPQANRIERWHRGAGLTPATIYDRLLNETELPSVVDNRSNTAAYGEWQCGVARGFRHVLHVELGHKVGSAMILDGRMWRGARGLAGEIGFTTIDIDSERTLDSVASGTSIVRRVQERLHRDRTSSLSRLAIPRDREMTLEDVVNSARAGDELAQVVIERTGLYLGIGLSGLINLLNPELVVIGGTAMLAGELILKPIIAETERRTFDLAFKNCRVVAAQLGANAGMIGAAMLARDSLL